MISSPHRFPLQQVSSNVAPLLKMIPNILPVIRENLYQRRNTKLHLKMFLKGVLVPEKPHVLKAFIDEKIKNFLQRKQNDRYLTLMSRFINMKTKVLV